MDDFGNGYSSLNMLSSTNIDILKMDMRFMEGEGLKSLGILDAVLPVSYTHLSSFYLDNYFII